jgi:hypothetical protein
MGIEDGELKAKRNQYMTTESNLKIARFDVKGRK